MKQFTIAFFSFCIAIFQLNAQPIIPPIDIPLFLSGNFGELRSNHFHSGIDFKTQGVIGIPVKAVKDGYVSRINISPWGYGNALYVTHPDGTKTLYGHLDRFVKSIETFARDSQYIKEKFQIELYPQPWQLPVKQGEIIAYSGNSGGSGGPHLHFEIRDAITDDVYDPLPYYKSRIRDNVPPEVKGLMIFPQAGMGIVNGRTQNQEISITKDKTGKTIVATVDAWGNIGLGVKAYDKMSGVNNIYLPKKISLEVDGVEVFSQNMDYFSFAETRYLNSLISFDDWVNNKSFFMKSFIEPGNRLNIYRQKENSGIISVDEERIYKCKYILSDAYENTTVFPFEIIGRRQAIPEQRINGILFTYNKPNIFTNVNVVLEIPVGNLYTNVDFQYKETPGYTPFSSLFQLGERTPLHSYCPLKIKIQRDTYPDKSKYGVFSVIGTKKSWEGGVYKDGYMNCEIRELGNYSVTIDTIAPKITPVTPHLWTQKGKISFKVTDDFSGVAEYKGTLNGKFVLFEYDPKNASMFCEFDPSRMKRGKQRLFFSVKDRCGNENIYSEDIVF